MKKIVLNGLIDVNCYIVDTSCGIYIIDPGSNKSQILEEIQNMTIKGVLLTHAHMDHIDQVGLFTCPIYIGANDYDMLFDNSMNCYDFCQTKPSYDFHKLDIRKVSDGDKIDDFTVIETPGHTRGSVSYLYKNKIFCGDTIFKGTVGRTDLPTGSMEHLKKSVLKLLSYDDKIALYPGHEEKTTVHDEKKNNYYYKIFQKSC